MYREIKQWPSACLKAENKAVEDVASVEDLIHDLIDTCNVKMGAGLAAPQIGINKKVLVIKPKVFQTENPDPSEYNPDYMVLINPVLESDGEDVTWKEGCLSLEGVNTNVVRKSNTMITYISETGEEKKLVAEWPFSGGLQHECDHLDGKLFIHRIPPRRRAFLIQRRNRKLKKIARAEKRARRALQ